MKLVSFLPAATIIAFASSFCCVFLVSAEERAATASSGLRRAAAAVAPPVDNSSKVVFQFQYWNDEEYSRWEEYVEEKYPQLSSSSSSSSPRTNHDGHDRRQLAGTIIDDSLIPFNNTAAFGMLAPTDDFYYYTEEVQVTQTWCALASVTAMLNSMRDIDGFQVVRTDQYSPYRYMTQDQMMMDLLSDDSNFCFRNAIGTKTNAVAISHVGVGIGNLPDLLDCFLQPNGYLATSYRDDDSGTLKETIVNAMMDPEQRVIVNFHRTGIGEVGGGHWSPIGAYNKEKDMFLLLDVAKYKYSFMWVPWKQLVEGTIETVEALATMQPIPDDFLDGDVSWYGASMQEVTDSLFQYSIQGPRGFVVVAPNDGATDRPIVDDDNHPTLMELICDRKTLSKFCSLISQCDSSIFKVSPLPFTLFAPNNRGVDELDSIVDGGLESVDLDVLCNIMAFHVVPGQDVYRNEMECGGGDASLLEMSNGDNTRVKCDDDGVAYGIKGGGNSDTSYFMIVDDELKSGSVVHEIDNVLLTPADMKQLGL